MTQHLLLEKWNWRHVAFLKLLKAVEGRDGLKVAGGRVLKSRVRSLFGKNQWETALRTNASLSKCYETQIVMLSPTEMWCGVKVEIREWPDSWYVWWDDD